MRIGDHFFHLDNYALEAVWPSAYVEACLRFSKQHQKLSSSIPRIRGTWDWATPPHYLFSTSGDVAWQDAAVGWTLFYHLLPDGDLENRVQVQQIIDRIKDVGLGHFLCFRWDSTKQNITFASPAPELRPYLARTISRR